MKSNEVHYYDLSGNDSWQLKMIKLINIFNYSIRQIQSTKCILNGVHQEKEKKTQRYFKFLKQKFQCNWK